MVRLRYKNNTTAFLLLTLIWNTRRINIVLDIISNNQFVNIQALYVITNTGCAAFAPFSSWYKLSFSLPHKIWELIFCATSSFYSFFSFSDFINTLLICFSKYCQNIASCNAIIFICVFLEVGAIEILQFFFWHKYIRPSARSFTLKGKKIQKGATSRLFEVTKFRTKSRS